MGDTVASLRRRSRDVAACPFRTRREDRSTCPSQLPRPTQRCSTGRRKTASPTRPSTSPRPSHHQRRAQGFRRRGQRRHHPGVHRWRGVRLRNLGQGHGRRRCRAGRVRARRGRREVRHHRRPAHRPLPEGQARHLRQAADRHLDGAGQKRRQLPLFQSHMWDGSAVPLDENLRDRQGPAAAVRRGATSSWRSRWVSSAARRTASSHEINDKLYTTPEDFIATVERAWRSGEEQLHRRRDLRQRARRVQARRRHAAAAGPQGGAGRRGQGARTGGRLQAVRTGLPRRIRIVPGGDRRGGVVRRDQDEHRHRHPVRLHPAARRALLQATSTAC